MTWNAMETLKRMAESECSKMEYSLLNEKANSRSMCLVCFQPVGKEKKYTLECALKNFERMYNQVFKYVEYCSKELE